MSSSVLDSTYNKNFPLTVGYGMTEATGAVTCMVKGSRKYQSVGGPIPNTEMKVVHTETGSSLAARETGEICVRGPQVGGRERESFQFLLLSILSFGVFILFDNYGCHFLSAYSPC
jgi:acyl-coenzyme A synthetase/AMP-(fatty) acid ligase